MKISPAANGMPTLPGPIAQTALAQTKFELTIWGADGGGVIVGRSGARHLDRV